MDQYITVTLIEEDDAVNPPFIIDTEVVAPNFVLKIGRLSIHISPERLAQLGRAIDSVVPFSASAVTETLQNDDYCPSCGTGGPDGCILCGRVVEDAQ